CRASFRGVACGGKPMRLQLDLGTAAGRCKPCPGRHDVVNRALLRPSWTPGETMSLTIAVENDPAVKRRIQEAITARLPQWFGRPDSNRHYAEQAEAGLGGKARWSGGRTPGAETAWRLQRRDLLDRDRSRVPSPWRRACPGRCRLPRPD